MLDDSETPFALPLSNALTHEVLVENLTPGQTYHFTLKSYDAFGNESLISNTISGVASADNVAPDFGGADKALKAAFNTKTRLAHKFTR